MAKASMSIDEMRQISGDVRSSDKVVQLLYLLLRDYISAGTLEKIVDEQVVDNEAVFTNGWLAKYAMNLADRLK